MKLLYGELILMNLIFRNILKNLCQVTKVLQNNELHSNEHFILTDDSLVCPLFLSIANIRISCQIDVDRDMGANLKNVDGCLLACSVIL